MPCKMRCAVFMFMSLLIGPSSAWQSDIVRLRDVQVITLRQGKYTTGRRSPPVLQLKCLGGTAGCGEAPSTVQCQNRGTDGLDVQWECKAEMTKSQKFGKGKITCEGYNSPQDNYILVGSCGLEYYLEKVDENNGPPTKPPDKPVSGTAAGLVYLFITVWMFMLYIGGFIYQN